MGEVLRAAWPGVGEVVSMVREDEEEGAAGPLRDGARGRAIERFARTPRHAKRQKHSPLAGRPYILTEVQKRAN